MASSEAVSSTVRRIAILVTSLDAAAGRQLMMAMPSHLARDVRKAMSAMTSIDPEEQRRVLAEFRTQAIVSVGEAQSLEANAARSSSLAGQVVAPARVSMAPGSAAEGVLGSTQVQPQTAVPETLEGNGATASAVQRPWQQLEVDAITELLSGERASVIAVLLSQIPPGRAAAVLAQLPKSQHRGVLAQLSRLGDIDPEAMAAIDDHLASRIADYQHRRASETESLGRMHELLSAATPELKKSWQEIISETDSHLAKRLGIAEESSLHSRATDAAYANVAAASIGTARGVIAGHAKAEATAYGQLRPGQSVGDYMAASVVTTVDTSVLQRAGGGDDEPKVIPFPAVSTDRPVPAMEIQQFEQILKLAPHQIARVLAAADGQVVLLALAGASPAFMQRFTAMLDKQDARDLHNRLKQLGTIHLQDVDEAQRRLCELASQIVADIRRGHSTANAAAA